MLVFYGTLALISFFIIFKCRLFDHQWEYFMHGRQCAWCNKHEKEWVCE